MQYTELKRVDPSSQQIGKAATVKLPASVRNDMM